MLIRPGSLLNRMIAVLCSVLLIPFTVQSAVPETVEPHLNQAEQEGATLSNDQLDSLVAPIALYPDPLLAQVLAASTYPLEIIQLQQWLAQHKDLKDQALSDAVAKQDWDPTVQGLAALPDVVKRLADDIAWTTDLGNAFLAQQSDVMSAVQRMRAKAKDKGNLKSNEQMKVETKTVQSQQVIVIEQANPQVISVPSYDPVVVYGAPAYPYPPIYYPPPGYYAAGMAISFGVGVAMGAMWSGGWCCNSGWGGNNNININNNNNFVKNSNRQGGNRPSQQPGRGGQGGNWQHNPSHRGGAPYANQRTADKFGGTSRGSSQAARQQGARQQQARQQASGRQPGGATGGRGGGPSAGTMDRGAGGRGGGASAGTMDRGAGGGRGGAGGGGDRVGNRSVSGGGGGGRGGEGLGGGGGRGSSASGARASSSRGASSMGGRGGGGRGGGGGRRR